MPNQGQLQNSAAVIGVELEKVFDVVYAQFAQPDHLLGMIPAKNNTYDVSSRLARIPVLTNTGSTFNQYSPDGGDMGIGGGSQYPNGVCTPVYFNQACAVTDQAIWSTDESDKSITNTFKDEFKWNLNQFRTNIEGLLCTSDGSGMLSTVTVTPAGTQQFLQVADASNFSAATTYQVFSTEGGTNRGNIIVNQVDPVKNMLWLTAQAGIFWPVGTSEGDLLIVSGASGAATQVYSPDSYTTANVAASLIGIPALNYSSPTQTGFFAGLPRADYPSIFDTPYINADGALTPQLVLQLEAYIQRAVDEDAFDEMLAMCNTDQAYAWELLGIVTNANVATAFVPQEGHGKDGDTRMDYLKGKHTKTLAGHELLINTKAVPGRLDFINMKHIYRIESKPCELRNVDGMTIFPAYGASGGTASSQLFYFVTGIQFATNRPRAAGYMTGLSEAF